MNPFVAIVKMGLESFLEEPREGETPVIVLDPKIWERATLKSESGTLEMTWRGKDTKTTTIELKLSVSLNADND